MIKTARRVQRISNLSWRCHSAPASFHWLMMMGGSGWAALWRRHSGSAGSLRVTEWHWGQNIDRIYLHPQKASVRNHNFTPPEVVVLNLNKEHFFKLEEVWLTAAEVLACFAAWPLKMFVFNQLLFITSFVTDVLCLHNLTLEIKSKVRTKMD